MICLMGMFCRLVKDDLVVLLQRNNNRSSAVRFFSERFRIFVKGKRTESVPNDGYFENVKNRPINYGFLSLEYKDELNEAVEVNEKKIERLLQCIEGDIREVKKFIGELEEVEYCEPRNGVLFGKELSEDTEMYEEYLNALEKRKMELLKILASNQKNDHSSVERDTRNKNKEVSSRSRIGVIVNTSRRSPITEKFEYLDECTTVSDSSPSDESFPNNSIREPLTHTTSDISSDEIHRVTNRITKISNFKLPVFSNLSDRYELSPPRTDEDPIPRISDSESETSVSGDSFISSPSPSTTSEIPELSELYDSIDSCEADEDPDLDLNYPEIDDFYLMTPLNEKNKNDEVEKEEVQVKQKQYGNMSLIEEEPTDDEEENYNYVEIDPSLTQVEVFVLKRLKYSENQRVSEGILFRCRNRIGIGTKKLPSQFPEEYENENEKFETDQLHLHQFEKSVLELEDISSVHAPNLASFEKSEFEVYVHEPIIVKFTYFSKSKIAVPFPMVHPMYRACHISRKELSGIVQYRALRKELVDEELRIDTLGIQGYFEFRPIECPNAFRLRVESVPMKYQDEEAVRNLYFKLEGNGDEQDKFT